MREDWFRIEGKHFHVSRVAMVEDDAEWQEYSEEPNTNGGRDLLTFRGIKITFDIPTPEGSLLTARLVDGSEGHGQARALLDYIEGRESTNPGPPTRRVRRHLS